MVAVTSIDRLPADVRDQVIELRRRHWVDCNAHRDFHTRVFSAHPGEDCWVCQQCIDAGRPYRDDADSIGDGQTDIFTFHSS